ALSKYDQEKMCLLVGAAYGIPTCALRFFNVYGTRQALSNPYTGVLAIFASRILNGARPRIFEDGLQRRDFVSVHDAAEACRLAMTAPAAPGGVFNVGSGAAVSVLEIAHRVAAALGRPDLAPEISGRYRVGDIRHCFADITQAQRGGVCASSLPRGEGRPWFDYPRPGGEPGHEGWGIVEAVAPDVTELSPGDLVATLGLDALAQYLVCPATECVRLPHRLAGRPFPGEALGCGFNVVRRAALEPAQRIAVVGGGFLGLLVGAIAHHLGAVVVVASRRAQARQLAEQLGAAATI